MTVDSCWKTCDRMKEALFFSPESGKKEAQKETLELHRHKAECAQEHMKEDLISAVLPGSGFSTVCMDLQQVMFVPMLTHSSMFYS